MPLAMKSFIYLIYSQVGIMIGKSSNINRRFAIIDTYSPIELQLLRVYWIEKNGIHERRLHKLFTHKRIRGGWFALDIDDIKEIDRYLIENKGTRILDNLKKFKKIREQSNNDSIQNPYHNLHQDIKKLEDVVDKLKEALAGRPNL